MSSGVPSRSIIISDVQRSRRDGSARCDSSVAGESTGPGLIALTRILTGPPSIASWRVIAITAPFVAAWPTPPEDGASALTPAIEPTLMIARVEDVIDLVAKDPLPRLVGELGDRREVRDAGVVVEDVEAAEVLRDGVDPAPRRSGVPEVEWRCRGHPAARGLYKLDGFTGAVVLHVAADDGGTLPREHDRRGPALTAAGTGDQRYFSVEASRH